MRRTVVSGANLQRTVYSQDKREGCQGSYRMRHQIGSRRTSTRVVRTFGRCDEHGSSLWLRHDLQQIRNDATGK